MERKGVERGRWWVGRIERGGGSSLSLWNSRRWGNLAPWTWDTGVRRGWVTDTGSGGGGWMVLSTESLQISTRMCGTSWRE